MQDNHELGYIIVSGLKLSVIYDAAINEVRLKKTNTTGNAHYYNTENQEIFVKQRVESVNFELRRGKNIDDFLFTFTQTRKDDDTMNYHVSWEIHEQEDLAAPEICIIDGKCYRHEDGKYAAVELTDEDANIVRKILNLS